MAETGYTGYNITAVVVGIAEDSKDTVIVEVVEVYFNSALGYFKNSFFRKRI